MRFVQNPYFIDENVEKEKGIITQEIKMYDDNLGWVLFMNLQEHSDICRYCRNG